MLNTSLSLILMSATLLVAPAQNDLDEAARRAGQCVEAVITGNYEKLIDLTYPRALELGGGRVRMTALMKEGVAKMKADGVEFLPAQIDQPREVIEVGGQKLVVVTYLLRMKVPGGTLTRESLLVGVKEKPGDEWTFVDVTALDAAVGRIFPSAAEKLRLPPRKQPVFRKGR
jgi:hypothetical protein